MAYKVDALRLAPCALLLPSRRESAVNNSFRTWRPLRLSLDFARDPEPVEGCASHFLLIILSVRI